MGHSAIFDTTKIRTALCRVVTAYHSAEHVFAAHAPEPVAR